LKIGIIGAGFTGLSAAYRLLKDQHEVTIFERDEVPGGLAIGYMEEGWEWSLEQHYHHWFTNDNAVLGLAHEIGHKVVIKRPKTSSFVENEIFQLDSPLTLLKFPKLTLSSRIRMAISLGLLRFNPYWKPLEKVRASVVLPRMMGNRAYEMLWEPLLVNKFGKFAGSISLAWFWARITKRTSSLAYPEGGFLAFAEHLSREVQEAGGKIYFASEVSGISSEKGRTVIAYKTKKINKNETFDRIIVTLPSFAFNKIASELPDSYKKKLMSLKGIGAVNLVMRMKKPFFSDKTYWLSVCEKDAPVLAVVEHTNFMDKRYYNNESLVYLGNYLQPNHPYFSMSEKDIMKEIGPFLKRINPEYDKSVISIRKFAASFAQPVIPTNYSGMIPKFKTPIKNVFLANMQQVYPWDRGTNYAVELGYKVAGLISNEN